MSAVKRGLEPTGWGIMRMQGSREAITWGGKIFRFDRYYGVASPGYHVAQLSRNEELEDNSLYVAILRENRTNDSLDLLYVANLDDYMDADALSDGSLSLRDLIYYIDPLKNGVEFTFGELDNTELPTVGVLRITWDSSASRFSVTRGFYYPQGRSGGSLLSRIATLLGEKESDQEFGRTAAPEYSYNSWYYGRLGENTKVYFIVKNTDLRLARLISWDWSTDKLALIRADLVLDAERSGTVPGVDMWKIVDAVRLINHPNGLLTTFDAEWSPGERRVTGGWLWDMSRAYLNRVNDNTTSADTERRLDLGDKDLKYPCNNRYLWLASVYNASASGLPEEGAPSIYAFDTLIYEVGAGARGVRRDAAIIKTQKASDRWRWWAGEDYAMITNGNTDDSYYVDTNQAIIKTMGSGVITADFSDIIKGGGVVTFYSEAYRDGLEGIPLSVIYTTYPALP
jgi:hypothetical protein